MKKFIGILSLLLVVLLSFSSFAMSASAAEFRDFYEVPEYFYGDVDFDGKVSVKDATALQKHLAKIITLEEDALYFGDVDGNEKNTISDATLIQKYVAKMIDIFPVEEIFADYYCKADGEEVLVELKNEIGILIEITVEEAGFYNVSAATGGETDIYLEVFREESEEFWFAEFDGETYSAFAKLEAGTYYAYMFIEEGPDTMVQFKASPVDGLPFDVNKAQKLNAGDKIQIKAGTDALLYEIDISQIDTENDGILIYTEGENPLVSLMCYDANYGFNSQGYDDGTGNTVLNVYYDGVNTTYYVVVTQAEGGSDFTLCCNTSFGILMEEAKEIDLGTADEIFIDGFTEEYEDEVFTYYNAQVVYKFTPEQSGYYSFNFESNKYMGVMLIVADINNIENSSVYMDMAEEGGRLYDVCYLEAGVDYYVIGIIELMEEGVVTFTVLNSNEAEYLAAKERFPFEDSTPDEEPTEISLGETVTVELEANEFEYPTKEFVFTAEEDCTVVLYSENSIDALVNIYDEDGNFLHTGDDMPLFGSLDFTVIGTLSKGETVYFSLVSYTQTTDNFTFTIVNEADYVPLG